MPFEWLPTNEAADALGVDVVTLQAWIDSGRAPSRQQSGRVEVLIEFDAEEQGSATRAESDTAEASRAAANDTADSADGGKSHDDTIDDRPHTEVVLARELQLAAGCVAAWQRLAEHADGELTRTRRNSLVAWSLVAALVVVTVIGVWWSTKTISTGRADTEFVQHQLDGASQSASERLSRISELEVKSQRLADDLAKARDAITDAEHRAAVAQVRVDQLTTLNKQLEQLSAQRAAEHDAVVASLRSTNTEQASRITRLESDVKAASDELTITRKQLAEAQAAVAAAGRDLSQSRQEAAAAQQRAAEAEQRADKADKSLAEAQQREQAGAAKQAAANEALTKATAERDALKAKLDTETSDHTQTRATMSQLEARIKSLEADLKAAREASKSTPPAEAPPVEASKPQATADAGTTGK